jgi:hypothetical protein
VKDVAREAWERASIDRDPPVATFREVMDVVMGDDRLERFFVNTYGEDLDRVYAAVVSGMSNSGLRAIDQHGDRFDTVWGWSTAPAASFLEFAGVLADGTRVYRDEQGSLGTVSWKALRA